MDFISNNFLFPSSFFFVRLFFVFGMLFVGNAVYHSNGGLTHFHFATTRNSLLAWDCSMKLLYKRDIFCLFLIFLK